MNLHKNARLTPKGRELLVARLEREEHPNDEAHALFTNHGLHNTGMGGGRDDKASLDGPPVDVEISPRMIVQMERSKIYDDYPLGICNRVGSSVSVLNFCFPGLPRDPG